MSNTIRTETITNENLEMLFRFRFRNDHVGHAQATTAGLTYEINYKIPEDFLSLSLSLSQFNRDEIQNPGFFFLFFFCFACNCFCEDGMVCVRS